MSKGAVLQLTRGAGPDLAPKGIRVNSISPGWTWTRETDKVAEGDREKFDPILGEVCNVETRGPPRRNRSGGSLSA